VMSSLRQSLMKCSPPVLPSCKPARSDGLPFGAAWVRLILLRGRVIDRTLRRV
jgi:hypothetical protein